MAKAGITKPIVCPRCKKKVGTVSIKPKFQAKLIKTALLISLVFQIIAEAFIELVKWVFR